MVCAKQDSDYSTPDYCILVDTWDPSRSIPDEDTGYTEEDLYTAMPTYSSDIDVKMVCRIDDRTGESGMNNPLRFDYCVDLIRPTALEDISVKEPENSYIETSLFAVTPSANDKTVINFRQ